MIVDMVIGGPVDRFDITPNWQEQLKQTKIPAGLPAGWLAAVILKVSKSEAVLGLRSGRSGLLPLENVRWARRALEKTFVGPRINAVSRCSGTGRCGAGFCLRGRS